MSRTAWPAPRRRAIAVIVIGAITAAACSSGDRSGEEPAPTVSDPAASDPTVPEPTTTVAGTSTGAGWLAGAEVVEPVVAELGTIRFRGVDTGVDSSADLSALELLLSTGDGPVSLPVYLEAEELTAVAPPHPVTPGSGGEIELQLVAGADRSGVMVVTLEPPPPAAGAFAAVVDRLRAAIDGSAAELGSSYAELAATDVADVPMSLRPLKLVQGHLDDGTEHDLESLPSTAGLDEGQRAQLDALVAHLELVEHLGPIPGAGPQGFRAHPEAVGVAARELPTQSAGGAVPTQSVGGVCVDGNVQVGDVAELVTQMKKGVDAIVAEGGAEARVLAAIQSLGAVIGSLPLGAYGEIMGVIFDMFSLIEMYKSSVAGQYPTELTDLVAELSITEFNEDFTQDGRVTNVTLTAWSTGWDASRLVAAAASAVTGALSSKLTGRLADQQTDDLAKQAIERGGQLRDSLTGRYIDAVTADNYSICPQPFTVTFDDTTYVELETSTAHLDVDDASLTYRPARIGQGYLRIRADSRVFSGRSVEQVIPVETKELQVIATPPDVQVQRPGEIVQVTARLEHADTTTLAWHSGPGKWADGGGDDTNEPGTRPYETPTDPDDYPYVMEIESTSTTGLRATATNVHNDSVTFRLAEIIVTPNPGSVEVGKPLTFTATDKNGNPVDVTWTATGGTIPPGPSKTAVYTAGDETGEYEVTATLASNPTVSVTVPVNVGGFCLEGTWRINADAFAAMISSSGSTVTPAGGTWDLTVQRDGSFVSVLDGFALAMTVSGMEARLVMNGGQTGRVLATATEIQGVETTSFALDITLETPNGSMSLGESDAPTGTEFGGGPYRCEGDQLIVMRDGYDILYDRID